MVQAEDMYREWPAHPALARRIACLWMRRSAADGAALVVPDGCVDLIWTPRGPLVAGPDTGPHLSETRAGDVFSGIRFRPGAVGDVFGVPVEALRDLRVPLSELPGFSLAGAHDLERAVAVRLRRGAPPDPAGGAIARALLEGGKVAAVARDLGLSERHLHRRCLRAFGYGPKTLQRVVRFQRALTFARAGAPQAQVAAITGYTDQAHMANDVRRLAGVPLGQLLNRP